MDFFEAAANWADRQAVDVRFARDQYDGWFASLHFSDSKGPYSATVNAVHPRPKRAAKKKDGVVVQDAVPAESFEDFENRVAKLCVKATVAARQRRMNAHTRIEKVASRDLQRREEAKREFA